MSEGNNIKLCAMKIIKILFQNYKNGETWERWLNEKMWFHVLVLLPFYKYLFGNIKKIPYRKINNNINNAAWKENLWKK